MLQFWNEILKPFLIKYYPLEKTNLFIKNSDIEFLIKQIDKYNKIIIDDNNNNEENNNANNDEPYKRPSFKEISYKLNLILQKRKSQGLPESISYKKTGSLSNIRHHSQTIASISTSDEDIHPINKTDTQKNNIINDIVYEDITENININNETDVSNNKDNEVNINENININSCKNNNKDDVSPFSEDLKNNITHTVSKKSKTVIIRVISQYYKPSEECEKETIIHNNKNNNIKFIDANLLLKKIIEENFMEKNSLILDALLQQCFAFIKKEVLAKKIINCFKYYKKSKITFNKIQNLIFFLNAYIIRMVEYYNGLPRNDNCLITLKNFYYELIDDTMLNLDTNNEIALPTNLSEYKNNITNTEILLKIVGKNPIKDKKTRLQKKLIFNECQRNLADINQNDFQNRILSFQVNQNSYNSKGEKIIQIPDIPQNKNTSDKIKTLEESSKSSKNLSIITENKKNNLRKSNFQKTKSIWALDYDDDSSNNSEKSDKTNKTNKIIINNNKNKLLNIDPNNFRKTMPGFDRIKLETTERKKSVESNKSFSINNDSFSYSNSNTSNSNCSSNISSRKGSLELSKKDIKKDKLLSDAELVEILSFEKEEENINLIKNRQIISNEEIFLLNLNYIIKILEKGEYKPEAFIHIKKHQKFFKDISFKKEKMLLNNKKEGNDTLKYSFTKTGSIRNLGKSAKINKNMQKGYFCIIDWETEDIGNSLIEVSKKMINKIQYKELYCAIYLKKTKETTSPNIVENVTKFNQLVSFVVEDILSYDYPSDRAKVIEKWVDVAEYCKLRRDYNDCVAIICAMNNYIITGLSLTLKEVKKQTKLLINQLNEFCTCNGNYKNLREEIKNLKNNEFYIPYLGIILKDLAFYEENSKYIDDGLINLEKIEKVQKSMDDFFKFKYCVDKPIKTIPELNFFENLENLKESDLEELANNLEPVFKLEKPQKKNKRLTTIDKKYFMGHVKRQSAMISNNSLMQEMLAKNFE